ncbi:MAG: hypothetical protein QW372_02675 [Nitrososphaerales archaeon]
MKKIRGYIIKIDRDSINDITRIVLNYAGRVRYATFKGKPPKGLDVNKSCYLVVDNAKLKLIECKLLDKYGNLSKRIFP